MAGLSRRAKGAKRGWEIRRKKAATPQSFDEAAKEVSGITTAMLGGADKNPTPPMPNRPSIPYQFDQVSTTMRNVTDTMYVLAQILLRGTHNG